MKDLGFQISLSDEGIPLIIGDHLRPASAEEAALWKEAERLSMIVDVELSVVGELQRRLGAADPGYKPVGSPAQTTAVTDAGRTTVSDMLRWLSNFEDDVTVVMQGGSGRYRTPHIGFARVRMGELGETGQYITDEEGEQVVAIRGH